MRRCCGPESLEWSGPLLGKRPLKQAVLPIVSDRPWFVVVGGINGAGKTTTSEMLAGDVDPQSLTFLNPDLETARVLAANPTLTQTAANFRGLRIVREEIDRLMAARRSLVVETVFANQAYLRLVERAKSEGYGVRLLFFGLQTVEQSIRRVAMRVAAGGHNLPEEDIRRRWPLVHENLTRAAAFADAVAVYASYQDGQPPRLVATVEGGRVTILDRDTLPLVTAALDAAG